jgi:hypothetical protein
VRTLSFGPGGFDRLAVAFAATFADGGAPIDRAGTYPKQSERQATGGRCWVRPSSAARDGSIAPPFRSWEMRVFSFLLAGAVKKLAFK